MGFLTVESDGQGAASVRAGRRFAPLAEVNVFTFEQLTEDQRVPKGIQNECMRRCRPEKYDSRQDTEATATFTISLTTLQHALRD